MTIYQHASFDVQAAGLNATSNKNPAVAKMVAAWENKNAKRVMQGSGLALMAMSLTACGSSSTTPAATTTTATTTTATTTTVVAGTAQNLSSRGDTLTGTAGDDTFDGQLVNEGGVANVQTMTATDTITDASTTDNDTLTVGYTTAVTPFSIANIENITLTDQDAGTEIINLVNVTGLKALTLLANVTATDVDNVGNIVVLNITNNTVQNDLDYIAAAVASTTDTQVVNLTSHTQGTLILDAGIEAVTINSLGSVVNVLTALTATGVATATITGTAGFTGTFGTAATTIDASAVAGVVTITQTGAQISNITTGDSADIIDVSGNFVDGTAAATRDTIDGGDGNDRLILSAAEAVAVTTVAEFSTVTSIETIVIDDDFAANGTVNMVALGVSNIEFDAEPGTLTVTAVTGAEVQFDFADNATDVRAFNITGTATTDALTIDINGVDVGAGAHTYTGIETLTIATSGTSLMDGAHVMTATAATETMNITGTGTLTLGNITADAVTSTMTAGTLNLGTMQAATNITSGADAMTVIGSTAADIFNGGGGADFFQTHAVGTELATNDIITGGAGFDTFTLVGATLAGAVTNYLGAANIADYTVGTGAANTDFIRFTANNTSYDDDGGTASGLGDSAGTDAAAANDAIVIQTVAQNATAAATIGGTMNMIKLTTGVVFTTNLQTTFNNAIGTGTITGLTADSQLLFTMFDTTNSVMVIGSVDVNGGGTTTVAETADVVNLIATVDMTATDYALMDTDNYAVFIA